MRVQSVFLPREKGLDLRAFRRDTSRIPIDTRATFRPAAHIVAAPREVDRACHVATLGRDPICTQVHLFLKATRQGDTNCGHKHIRLFEENTAW